MTELETSKESLNTWTSEVDGPFVSSPSSRISPISEEAGYAEKT